ncbi:helix-turn-helix domain-containing protein [Thalassobaculum sp.]|uniref:helix-turn-helix domain-containing protein n=1 Tax=Thalassobaculum sp. TaxID=2022740 RepID=UPI003B5BDECD
MQHSLQPADKRDVARLFRERLAVAMDRAGLSRSAVAKRIGVDRSTLSQILSDEGVRLPRADTVASLAVTLQVSLDWLLGLAEEGQFTADIMERSPEISPHNRTVADENLLRWHAEAAGYKIRYVPTSLPDQVKIPEVIAYEYQEPGGSLADQAMRRSRDRLEYVRQPETDVEICTSIQCVRDFADGSGIWRDLPLEVRRRQLTHIADLVDELYPSVRWVLFDGVRDYAIPVTIFGPKRAAIYAGDMYIVFTTTEHIRVLTRRFDELIRHAVVHAHEIPAYMRTLIDRIDKGLAA